MISPATPAFEFDPERHLYTVAGKQVLSVTQVLAKAGICDFSHVDEEVRIHSMKRGQSVHWMLQLEDEGALNYRTVPRSLKGYRKAYKTWKQQSGFTPLWIERRFVSNFGYAGTIDRAGSFPATTMFGSGTSAVVDLKSGPIADWTKIQLAAYAVGAEPKMYLARNIRRIALSVGSDGKYGIKEFSVATFDQDWARFMEALKQCQI